MKPIIQVNSAYKLFLYVFFGIVLFLAGFIKLNNAQAATTMTWDNWVQQLRQDAIADGVSANLFDHAFAGLTPNQSILHFDKHQPEKRITFLQYRATRIDSLRIRLGQTEYQKNAEILNTIGHAFGVDPCIITAIWGMETSYGRYMGNFSVIRSLATLAYASPRADYFRGQLIIALHILDNGHVSLNEFKGEWAGASGIPQFMPSSWLNYAVDYDQDGRKNIWSSRPDAFASIANYFRANGWQTNQPWGLTVTLPSGFDDSLVGLKQERTIEEWLSMGVRPTNMADLPHNHHLMASIIRPNGGPDFMVFNNFKVIMKYNNSTFYAASIGYLADKICGRE
jgi:membrane-bound lytic murein transglycosylase B